MQIITIDFETYYDPKFSLSKITTEDYIRHELFEVIGVAVKANDGETQWFSGPMAATKKFLAQFDWGDSVAIAHNAMFDMAILSWHFDIQPKRIADTLSMARALLGAEGISLSLKSLAEYFQLGAKGTEVLNALGKGRIDFSPEVLARYGEYCINDVELTYELFKLLADGFPMLELRLIDLTLRMFTEPKLELDKCVLEDHLRSVQEKKTDLLSKIAASKEDIMSNPKLAQVLTDLGVTPPTKISPTTGKETHAFAKSDEGFKKLLDHKDAAVQALVAARLGVKSTLEETRTERFIKIADRGPLPIPLRYYAAHTGRWGGDDKVNLQNLPRKSPLKKAIRAPDGYLLVDCDSSQIEARTLAWLAEQDDLVDAFAAGEDVYKIMASSIYGKLVEDITEQERFVGKTTILGAGYGMGGNKFRTQLKTFGVDMPLMECNRIIKVYRDTYEYIPKLWDLGGDALDAIIAGQAHSTSFGRKGVLDVDGHDGITLPNTLRVQYPKLRWVKEEDGPAREMVYDTRKGRNWVPNRIYGGKCLGAETEVLTERGWVPIVQVTSFDRVWDGIEWVNHDGLIYQGKKCTIVLDGVHMTPDHEVLTEEGWHHASSCEGLHRAGFWMPDGVEVCGDKRAAFDVDLPLHLRKRSGTWSFGHGKVRSSGRKPILRLYDWGKEQVARYVEAPRVRRVAVDEGSLPTTYASGMAQLRRTGYYSMLKVGWFLRGILGGYGSNVYAGTYARPEGQQRKLHPRELPLGDTRNTGSEYALRTPGRFKEGSCADGCFTLDTSISVAPQPVYDLRNSGPRSRFVVRGISDAFIVHNCVENVCQALARIIIGEQMLMIARRYKVVMTVHDSVVTCVPEAEADEARAFIEGCMRIRPKWAPGLPLNCESKMGKSYGG